VIKNSQQDEKSRAQIKREFRGLKELGIQLGSLSKGQLRAIPLSEETRTAVLSTHGIARNSLQRHYRYLSALLVEEDVAAIRVALAAELQPHAKDVANLHEAERWRDKLLSTDEGQLAAFVKRHPQCDPQHLGQLVQAAKQERDLDQPPKSARQLFRYLRQQTSQKD